MSTADSTDFGIFYLPRDRVLSRGELLSAIAIAAAAWVGAVAFVGGYRETQVTALLARLAPREVLYWAAVATCALSSGAALWARRPGISDLGLLVAAYLLGHQLFGSLLAGLWIRGTVPFDGTAYGVGFAANRLLYAAPILLTMLAARQLFARSVPLHLGFGDWRVASRDVGIKGAKRSWARLLFPGFAASALGLALLFQVPVGFAPLRSGALLGVLPAVLIASLVNAVVEELVFRGLLQPAFVHALGVRAGLWLQGLLFGLMHFGLSVGVLAALPTSLLIGLGSVVWGKAALETRGLGWVVVAHALIDVGVMSAYFVR